MSVIFPAAHSPLRSSIISSLILFRRRRSFFPLLVVFILFSLHSLCHYDFYFILLILRNKKNKIKIGKGRENRGKNKPNKERKRKREENTRLWKKERRRERVFFPSPHSTSILSSAYYFSTELVRGERRDGCDGRRLFFFFISFFILPM